MGMLDFEGLQAAVEWMRANGVCRLSASDGPMGIVELELDTPPIGVMAAANREPKKSLTAEEERAQALGKRRARYERELGRKLTDQELEMLP